MLRNCPTQTFHTRDEASQDIFAFIDRGHTFTSIMTGVPRTTH